MKLVKPIYIKLGITETLLIIRGLSYIIDDMDAHPTDQKLAEKLKQRILYEVEAQSEEGDALGYGNT